jgi:hypothetical protein
MAGRSSAVSIFLHLDEVGTRGRVRADRVQERRMVVRQGPARQGESRQRRMQRREALVGDRDRREGIDPDVTDTRDLPDHLIREVAARAATCGHRDHGVHGIIGATQEDQDRLACRQQ